MYDVLYDTRLVQTMGTWKWQCHLPLSIIIISSRLLKPETAEVIISLLHYILYVSGWWLKTMRLFLNIRHYCRQWKENKTMGLFPNIRHYYRQ